MLFKLSLKNIKKSVKDYTIYFFTLILGVAIFYVFNSLDSQQAMMNITSSTQELIGLMLNMLAGVSVFIAFILGFLIVYANNFLIKRRKKEFGIYMTLGMGKKQISKILLGETIVIGVISLIVGLVIGIFASQLMSILVAKMFETDMSNFEFVFSKAAMIKTAIYFSIIYVAVAIFNTFAISKYKLIDLITAIKKNETIKLKNPIVSVLLFLASIAILGYAYYMVVGDAVWILYEEAIYLAMALGVLGTFLFFWSLSGFILRLVQANKKIYFKDLNIFVLRQMNSKINTTVLSMTVICLLLFVTIVVLSSAWSLNDSMKRDLKEVTPVDISINKTMDIPDTKESKETYSEGRIEDSKISVMDTLETLGFDKNQTISDYIEITGYSTSALTMKESLGSILEEAINRYRFLEYDTQETIVAVSDYNKVAHLFGHEKVSVNANEYSILCDYEQMKALRDRALEEGTTINLNGKIYYPKEQKCLPGFVQIAPQHMNTGIFIVPDEAVEGLPRESNYLNMKYKAETQEEKRQLEEQMIAILETAATKEKDLELDSTSKIAVYDSSKGLGATITFVALYLGVIFLISGAAILALKELSESSDNKERYDMLRKLGASDKMIHRSLFRQIGIFFMIPLILAIVHAIFGIQFATKLLEGFGQQNMLPSIISTAAFIVCIYGGYFIVTYLGSKNIIKDNTRN